MEVKCTGQGDGVALVQFAAPLGFVETLGMKLLLAAVMVLITFLTYGPGTRLLEPATRP